MLWEFGDASIERAMFLGAAAKVVVLKAPRVEATRQMLNDAVPVLYLRGPALRRSPAMVEPLVEVLAATMPCSCIGDVAFVLGSSAGVAMTAAESSTGAAEAIVVSSIGTATTLSSC
jgi:hypothetical protein